MLARIVLTPSRLLRYLRWGQTLLAVMALFCADLPLALQITIGLCLLWWASSGAEQASVLFFSPTQLVMKTPQELVPFRLKRECHCHPQLLVLRYRLDIEVRYGFFSPWRALVLLADSSAPDSLRELRTLLRWHAFNEDMLL